MSTSPIPLEPAAFAASLVGVRDWSGQRDAVAAHLAADVHRALPLATAIDDVLLNAPRDPALQSMRQHVFAVVASMPVEEATTVAIALVGGPSARMMAPVAVASHLASTRPAEELRLHVDRRPLDEPDVELDLLLTHELVARGEAPPRALAGLTEAASGEVRELAVLPGTLLASESGLHRWLRHYAPGGSSQALAALEVEPADDVELDPVLLDLGPVASVDVALVAAPFREWLEQSNGRASAQRFLRRSSGRRSAPEPAPVASTGARRAMVNEVVELLFSAACSGGAYTDGVGAAWGRLRAWQGIAGMVDCSWPSALTDLEAVAHRVDWWVLDPTDCAWFDQVAWDMWIVAASAEHITFVAATDTD